jgi:hypothetical protein
MGAQHTRNLDSGYTAMDSIMPSRADSTQIRHWHTAVVDNNPMLASFSLISAIPIESILQVDKTRFYPCRTILKGVPLGSGRDYETR